MTSQELRERAHVHEAEGDGLLAGILLVHADALDEIDRLRAEVVRLQEENERLRMMYDTAYTDAGTAEATLAAVRRKCNEFADSDICVKEHEIARTVLAMLDGTAQEEPNGGPQS